MPTIDEETSEVAVNLRAVYEVDEASVDETRRKTEEAQRSMIAIQSDMQKLSDREFQAFQGLQKEAQERHFKDMEDVLDNYWKRRLDLVRGNVNEERRVLEQHGQDMARLRDMHEKAEKDRQQQAGARGGIQTGGSLAEMTRFRSVLGSIGWGSIMGMASITGAVAMIAQSIGQLRASRTEARDIQEIAGRDPEFAFGLAPMIQHLTRQFPGQITRAQAGRVAAEFSPIAPGGMTGGESIGRRAEEAILIGKGAGVDSQLIARLMRQFHLLEGEALPRLKDRVFETIHAAEQAGMPARDFINILTQLTAEGRKYNLTIPESTRVVGLFAREIQEGTISIRELQQMQHSAAQAPMGVQALLGQQILGRGGPVGGFLRSIGATDPFSAGVAVRALAQGGLPTVGGDIIGATEQSPEQLERVEHLRAAIERMMPEMVERLGDQAAPGLTGVGRTAVIQQLFSTMLGVSASTLASTQDLIDALLGRRAAVGGALPDIAGERPKTVEELMKEGEKSLVAAISIIDRFKGAIGEATDVVGRAVLMGNALLSGDFEEFNRLRGEQDISLGQMPSTGAVLGGGMKAVKMGLNLRNPFEYIARSLIGAGIRVIIENRAGDDVSVEVQGGEPAGDRFTPQGNPNVGEGGNR